MTLHYTGPLPIPDATLREWYAEGVDAIRVVLPVDLDLLTELNGEGLLDWADEQIGTVLYDSSYGVAYEATAKLGEEVGEKSRANRYDSGMLAVWFEGDIEWSFHEHLLTDLPGRDE